MPLVPALCTQCGAKLEIESSNEATVCPYCKTPFITEKAINNYNTTNVTNIKSLHADVVNISNGRSIDDKFRAGETFLKMNDYSSAESIYKELTREYPFDFRGWQGLIKVKSREFKRDDLSRSELISIAELYRKACTVASDEEKSRMDSEYLPYYNSIKSQLDQAMSTAKMAVDRLTDDYMRAKTNLEDRIEYIDSQIKNAKNPRQTIKKITKIIVWIIAIYNCVTDSVATGILAWITAYIIGRIISNFLGSVADSSYKKKISRLMQESAELKNNLRNVNCQYDNDIDKYADILEKVGDKI